ncbi:MFS transporter [Litoreibacter janthinus]|uniref:Glycoside/pentoside/hexuronide:cation symporter, GPH family n=1 Tax=Litoreibacter janthinus TaxID=670154 RepID=A0A1I6G3K1_9RHOB|nr:MFS transporter [Litoreibacter janthinus]SFR36784.1 glycoside/pentoside/hexuronide:cation symporter, GPH family [Litoreibacter janthinus]
MSSVLPRVGDRLAAYSLFAAVLSGAGLPIYIYAPKYYADTYGVSLAALAAVLFGLRLFDVVQDPVLGWISERLGVWRKAAVAAGAAVLALSMLGLFGVAPPIAPIWWFGLTITGLFTAFSFLTINFYAQGIAKAETVSGGHTTVAAWRETGALLGVCVAAVTPTLLQGVVPAPFAAFAAGFAGVTIIAAALMAPEWSGTVDHEPTRMRAILADRTARRLLLLALVNATPLAVSSTLFLFYVESRLGAPGWEGALLVLFFLAAAMSAPVWARLASTWGEKVVLLLAMCIAITAFGCVLTLGEGDVVVFAVICIVTGATIGADLTLLPALFARRMSVISPSGGQGFGLWSLVNKFTLAFAAAILLPALEAQGFVTGTGNNPEAALITLTLLYALVPCALKLVAIGILLTTPLKE